MMKDSEAFTFDHAPSPDIIDVDESLMSRVRVKTSFSRNHNNHCFNAQTSAITKQITQNLISVIEMFENMRKHQVLELMRGYLFQIEHAITFGCWNNSKPSLLKIVD